MGRSDVFWYNDGPEYDPEDRAKRMQRLEREELKTRILENNRQMLVDICEAFRKGWTKQ